MGDDLPTKAIFGKTHYCHSVFTPNLCTAAVRSFPNENVRGIRAISLPKSNAVSRGFGYLRLRLFNEFHLSGCYARRSVAVFTGFDCTSIGLTEFRADVINKNATRPSSRFLRSPGLAVVMGVSAIDSARVGQGWCSLWQ